MKTLHLNDNWDLHLDDKGNIATIDGAGSTALVVANAVSTHKGEHHANTEIGVDYGFNDGNRVGYLAYLLEGEVKRLKLTKQIKAVLYYDNSGQGERKLTGTIGLIDNDNNTIELTI